ncbi:hypothetical protein ROHU_003017 [Labeo rohita]|uniref:Uncharacterized protein n=1 Tax=Labeo rohita TaxID=84645 RepID=A0A498NY71_LABRO|nr:hypothetical protein ROHU_003017 [Labeo rohita]
MRWYWTSFGGWLNTPLPPGGQRWLLWLEGSRQRVPSSLLLPNMVDGSRQQAPASWRTAPTPPLPLGRQPPLLDPGARQRAFRPTYYTIAPAPPLRAATVVRFFVLPDQHRDPAQQRGLF